MLRDLIDFIRENIFTINAMTESKITSVQIK